MIQVIRCIRTCDEVDDGGVLPGGDLLRLDLDPEADDLEEHLRLVPLDHQLGGLL